MTGPEWWRDAVVYQLYIRSFADGDGDGIGDIAGMRSRLPYLADLGVDAVWVNPWFPSPMADGGYDVADYRDIDPRFGTLADADAFIAAAHRLGLRVLLDIVPNHTSDRHAWFRAALASPPGSRERERYIFRDGRGPGGSEPPTDWESVFGGPAWTRVSEPDGSPGQWYLHLFAPEQPDLDWSEPEVRAEFASILRFWYERGADGFRIDVAHGLVKDPDLPDLGPRPAPGTPEADAGTVRDRHIRTGTATASTTSTANGGRSPTRTASDRSSPRSSSSGRSAWRGSCVPTSCTPCSTSASSRRAGIRPRSGRRSTTAGACWAASAHRRPGCSRTTTRPAT